MEIGLHFPLPPLDSCLIRASALTSVHSRRGRRIEGPHRIPFEACMERTLSMSDRACVCAVSS